MYAAESRFAITTKTTPVRPSAMYLAHELISKDKEVTTIETSILEVRLGRKGHMSIKEVMKIFTHISVEKYRAHSYANVVSTRRPASTRRSRSRSERDRMYASIAATTPSTVTATWVSGRKEKNGRVNIKSRYTVKRV